MNASMIRVRGSSMKSKKRMPLHIARWLRKSNKCALLRPHTKFVNYGDGLVRAPTGDMIPAYRSRRVRTKVVKPDFE
jgi:hypothetical protein